MNLLCPLGIIDTKEAFKHQLRNLLIEAIEVKQSLLGKKHLLKLENKRELIVMDAESINYITTVKRRAQPNRSSPKRSRSNTLRCP